MQTENSVTVEVLWVVLLPCDFTKDSWVTVSRKASRFYVTIHIVTTQAPKIGVLLAHKQDL